LVFYEYYINSISYNDWQHNSPERALHVLSDFLYSALSGLKTSLPFTQGVARALPWAGMLPPFQG
jgi:hypothetical protein